MEIEHWKPEWGTLSEAAMRGRLEAEGYSVIRYDYPPGTRFSEHTHTFDKKDAVLSGLFLICAEGREFVLGPGDAVAVPGETIHSAEVIGSDAVISLDAARR
jgi:quercetin dioxygenase-like cupin family protein